MRITRRVEVLPLDGDWFFREVRPDRIRPPRLRAGAWRPARVPGTVHTDLLRLGAIPDPLLAENEREVQWVSERDWAYARRFDGPAALRERERVELFCEGLDTLADVWVNGRHVLACEDMYVEHVASVRDALRPGANEIAVRFRSARRESYAREARYGKLPHVEWSGAFPYVRKAAYSFGWDWGPRLPGCGIWRPIRIVAYDLPRIADLYVETLSMRGRRARLRASVEVEASAPADAEVEIAIGRGRKAATCALRGRLRRGRTRLTGRLGGVSLAPWWPAGHGRQALHPVRATLSVGGRRIDAARDRIGIRTVKLERRGDGAGESFIFRVNGVRIFARGANWIPDDIFLDRVTPARYRERVEAARAAKMNMLRVWGGGIYEDPAFYDACDERGILVWQDFPFACAHYPDAAWFRALVREEAEKALRALRNHPSIALWCGNNENQWLHTFLLPAPRLHGKAIYDRLLPALCRRFVPTVPYWPGSPYGGRDPNAQDRGDCHEWRVWNEAGPEGYLENRARFVSEFGWQAMPHPELFRAYLPPGERHPHSRVSEFHNRQPGGMERMTGHLARAYRFPTDAEGYAYASQVLQAEAIRTAVEHWRRRKFATAGALFWQLNDCWPVASWSAIDAHGNPKGLWYAARRFFADLLVCFAPSEGPVPVWIVSDRLAPVEAVLEIRRYGIDGGLHASQERAVRIPANRSRRVAVLPSIAGRRDVYLAAILRVRGREVSRNLHFGALPKEIAFPDPRLRARVRGSAERLRIEIRSEGLARHLAAFIRGTEARFSDNFFDLLPGETRVIEARGAGMAAREAARRLVFRTLAGAVRA